MLNASNKILGGGNRGDEVMLVRCLSHMKHAVCLIFYEIKIDISLIHSPSQNSLLILSDYIKELRRDMNNMSTVKTLQN